MRDDITVFIPTIPPRTAQLLRALASVGQQTYQPAAVSIAVDVYKEGAPATRQRALEAVRTKWAASLDDDDEFYREHLAKLLRHALDNQTDIVYSWFEAVGMDDPFPEGHFLNEFDPTDPIETTSTILIRTELAQDLGYKPHPRGGWNTGEDFWMIERAVRAGAKISHLVERTWRYYYHGKNTSGKPDRW